MDNYIKCADNLQCIKMEAICDGDIDCRDNSDELCDDYCLKTPLKPGEKPIIKKCQEDVDICVPVDKYCDGIAHCPDASDEIDCTCEDFGLRTCQMEDQWQINCLNVNWVQ